MYQPVIEGEPSILGRECWQESGHCGQDREASAPPGGAVGQPELGSQREDVLDRTKLDEPDHAFSEHQRQVLLEPFLQLPGPVDSPIGLARPGVDVHHPITHLDGEGRRIVCKRIKRAAA